MAEKRLYEINWEDKTDAEIDAILLERVKRYCKSIEDNGGKSPKRDGYIVERIAMIDNLREADKEGQKGKVRKNRHIRRHNLNAEMNLRALQRMILSLKFPKSEYSIMEIKNVDDKVRMIAKQTYFPWRILHHAIMRVIGPTLLKYMIYDTFACIKGKGLHFGVRRMKKMLRRYPEMKYFVKTDYKKFYHVVPHDFIKEQLRKRFKDEHFFRLLDVAVFSYCSDEDIEKLIEEENEKKRCCDWSVHKSADN